MDWSHCGCKNSSVPIPLIPVAETICPRLGEAVPFGNLKYPMGPGSLYISVSDTTVKDTGKDAYFLNFRTAVRIQGAYDS